MSRTLYEIVTHAAAAAITLLVAIVLVRLVPVLERFVIQRAKRARGRHAAESGIDLGQRIETLTRVTGSVARAVIWSVTLMALLGTVGISVAPLLAGAGIAGVAVGFGAQSIVKDFFAGFFILLEDQFGVGDTVAIAGMAGTVERMTLRITVLRDSHGIAYFIPNSSIGAVANKTIGGARVMLDTAFSTKVPEETAKAALDAAAKRIDGLSSLKDALMEPVHVDGPIDLTGGTVTYQLVGRVHADRAAELRRSLISALQAELPAHGLDYEGATITKSAVKPS
jgi:small conductance mechanosensitive channel